MIPKKGFFSIVFVFLLFTFYSREAYAYIDPGTVGYLFQLLLLAFSALFAILIFFRNKVQATIGNIFNFIKTFFGGSSA